ncbi:hypothetical protein MKW98_019775 [Papaver atlanticum]|uniref:PGG domain-containing protein n=1 Tax=Papaver atlanticum TaxID=357466 RepID=A0AAD4XWX2_9MAGN|nr:hypothetical protein MKW98_019775 [Papaver atlanticum]
MSTNTISTVSDDRDHRLHETIMLSTQHIVASIEALLGKVIESQAQNQLQMMEMLKILANNSRNSPIVIPNCEKHPPTVPSHINEQQAENDQVNEEDAEFNYAGYEPLMEAIIDTKDPKKAMEYLNDHRTVIKEIFLARDSRKEIHDILWDLGTRSWGWDSLLWELLKLVPPQTLEYVNSDGHTILHKAVNLGDIKFIKALVERNPNLTQIRSNEGCHGVPLVYAALSVTERQKVMVEYLYSVTKDQDPSPFSGEQGYTLLVCLISADMYGMALSVFRRRPDLVQKIVDDKANGKPSLLQHIVERPFAFLSGSKLKWWERCIYTLVEVDTDSAHDGGIGREKQNVNLGSITEEDEENPQETSKVFSLNEQCSSTSNYRSITKYISSYFRHYIRPVTVIRRLYDQKLMHKQVFMLTLYLLVQLDRKKMDERSIKDIFLKSNMLETAIKFETTEFALACLWMFPSLCWEDDEREVEHTLIKLVASERNEKIYNFVRSQKNAYGFDKVSKLDKNNNSILHYSAELPHNRRLNAISGAAFQMQREIQWFKVYSNVFFPGGGKHNVTERFIRNKDGNTAHYLFTENHKELMEKGEKWMKDTSTSCMVVAALIATVAFAAAITVAGGNINDNSKHNGLPVFWDKDAFAVFAIADSLALISSITSVLMFFKDFLKALPQKLIQGLVTLFISIASVLVSFGAAFTIILGQRFHWVPIAISLVSCAPVLLFGFLQFPLFVEMVSSTYWPTILRKQGDGFFTEYNTEIFELVCLAYLGATRKELGSLIRQNRVTQT